MNAQESSWIRRVMTAGSFADLKDELAHAAAGLGFAHYALRARYPNLRTGFNEISFDNCPNGWRRYYLKHGPGAESDPVRARAQQQTTPVLWRELMPQAPTLVRKAREFGFATGVIFPTHGPAGQWSALTMISSQGGVDAERAILDTMAEAHLLAAYAHDACARIIRRRLHASVPVSQPVPEVALSRRERECLVLAARGKTAAEIGRSLEISERTVTFHLTNARRKLGTASSPHAVVRAVSLGLIAAG
ncbi:MAG TPA: LuxR family transcriptional regulator [Burkholderiales bacterium]